MKQPHSQIPSLPWRVCPDCGWSYEAEGDTHKRRNCPRAFCGDLVHIPDPRFHPVAAKPPPRRKTVKQRRKS